MAAHEGRATVQRLGAFKTAGLALVLVTGPLAGQGRAAEPATVELSMSYYRYCAAETCTPADQAYVRSDSGPVPGADNPVSVVEVPAGGTVQWTYRDTGPGSCDSVEGCGGHNVVFEDGTAEGTTIGFTESRSGPGTISATITQQPGETIRYFCTIGDHYRLGMTGILQVVATAAG